MLIVSCAGPDRDEGAVAVREGQDVPAHGDILVEGSIGDASNLIPVLATDNASHSISGLIFNGLVNYDRDLNIVGDLAESWDISPDGLVITFHLRPGVTLARRAALHGRRRRVHLPRSRSTRRHRRPTAEDFRKVKKAEVLDPPHLPRDLRQALRAGADELGLLRDAEAPAGGQGRHQARWRATPIGTGPYRFKEWKTGQKIVLDYNPDYFEGRPYHRRPRHADHPRHGHHVPRASRPRHRPDGARLRCSTRARRRTGTSGRTTASTATSPFPTPTSASTCRTPCFRTSGCRQALSHAVNKQEIIDSVLLGLGQEATGPYKPGTWAVQRRREALPLRPDEGAGTAGRGRLERDTDGTASSTETGSGSSSS